MKPSARVLVTLGGIPLFGQERGNIEVFRALQSKGVDSLFVTNDAYGHKAIQPALDRLELRWTEAPYPTRWGKIRRPSQIWTRFRQAASTTRAFARITRSYMPTHVHTMNELYALILIPLFKALRIPVVYRVGDEPRQHHPIYRLTWRRLFAPSVDQFVAISEFIRGRLIEAGVPPAKVRVIYNFPPQRPAPPGGSDLPRELTAPYPGRTVVYLGQIKIDKGVDLLVEAAERLCRESNDVRFLLAGDYSYKNPFAERLVAHVEASGLADRIRFLGHVEDVTGLLALADVHVAPSVWEEPLSNVVGEAKEASVPSVVFPSGGLPELAVQHGLDAYVCPEKTVEALTKGLLHYVAMSAEELRTASLAARHSLCHLGITPSAFAQAWADVYATS